MRTTSLMLILGLVGCGGGTMGAVTVDMAAPPTDKQLCDGACAKLIGCGVEYDGSCSANCQNNAPIFLACVRQAPLECNALALCTFKQFQALACPGGGGYPTGTASCTQTAQCLGACNLSNPTAACACACNTALNPARALNLLINTQCSQARCAPCRAATFNGAACNNCHAAMCGGNPCFTS